MDHRYSEEISRILDREARAITSIPFDDNYSRAVELIHERVHARGGKVIASGMGKAGHVANHIAMTLSSTGTPSLFLHPSEAQHGDLGVIRENDVLLLLSNSGRTREILELVELTHALYAGIPLVIITGNPEGPLARQSDLVLFTGNPEEVCPLGLTPTTSATAMTVIGDILVVLLMKKIGFTSRDYARRHHGGYLGQKSRELGHEDH
ncbi:MAG: SIS domain-containing protein [Bacteroidetes bacterium]|nr:MAG: SIS domain-containing protein [Bacteroidota bacterium]